MTVSNLATIFGPNILQKEKPGEKDAGAMIFEDSAAIILVLQRLIEHHQTLFTVGEAFSGQLLQTVPSPLNSSSGSSRKNEFPAPLHSRRLESACE